MANSAEQRQSVGRRPTTVEETQSLIWPPVARLPEDGNVFLIFHGLFCFAYNQSEGVCEVGVHDDAPGHSFHIGAWEVAPALRPRLIFPESKQPLVIRDPITIAVDRPRIPNVGFFMPELAGNLHYHDWRRVPDLEGPNFFNQPLDRIPGKLRPIIMIRQGIFFTEMLTDHEFVRVDEGNVGDILDLGRIAFHVGADVSHAEGGSVTVKVGDQDILPPLVADATKKYVLQFSNTCPQDVPRCIFVPNSPIKEDRNDFHLYFRALSVPHRRREFMLVKKARPAVAPQVSKGPIGKVLDLDVLGELVTTSTHEAPCGSSSTGQTSGI